MTGGVVDSVVDTAAESEGDAGMTESVPEESPTFSVVPMSSVNVLSPSVSNVALAV